MDELGSMNGGQFKEIFNTLLREDRYMALADLRSYHEAQQRAQQLYRDQTAWNRMSLVNIAGAGRFAADRAIRDYCGNIWHASPVPPVKNLNAKNWRNNPLASLQQKAQREPEPLRSQALRRAFSWGALCKAPLKSQ